MLPVFSCLSVGSPQPAAAVATRQATPACVAPLGGRAPGGRTVRPHIPCALTPSRPPVPQVQPLARAAAPPPKVHEPQLPRMRARQAIRVQAAPAGVPPQDGCARGALFLGLACLCACAAWARLGWWGQLNAAPERFVRTGSSPLPAAPFPPPSPRLSLPLASPPPPPCPCCSQPVP